MYLFLLCESEACCSWTEPPHRVSLSWSVLNPKESSHTDSYGFQLCGALDLIQFASQDWRYVPSFWCIPFGDFHQDIGESEKCELLVSRFRCLAEGWKERWSFIYKLAASVPDFRLGGEAVLWRVGISASHSSSSGHRTARSWRERWLEGGWYEMRVLGSLMLFALVYIIFEAILTTMVWFWLHLHVKWCLSDSIFLMQSSIKSVSFHGHWSICSTSLNYRRHFPVENFLSRSRKLMDFYSFVFSSRRSWDRCYWKPPIGGPLRSR